MFFAAVLAALVFGSFRKASPFVTCLVVFFLFYKHQELSFFSDVFWSLLSWELLSSFFLFFVSYSFFVSAPLPDTLPAAFETWFRDDLMYFHRVEQTCVPYAKHFNLLAPGLRLAYVDIFPMLAENSKNKDNTSWEVYFLGWAGQWWPIPVMLVGAGFFKLPFPRISLMYKMGIFLGPLETE